MWEGFERLRDTPMRAPTFLLGIVLQWVLLQQDLQGARNIDYMHQAHKSQTLRNNTAK